MAIVRRFTPNAEDLLRYSYETGEKTGSKDNTLTTLKGRQVQGAQAQEAAIAAAQFRSRDIDRATALQQQREENQARLAANAQDNAVALEQTAARSAAVKDGREHDLTKIGMTADLAARNASLKATGGLQIPDATDGPIQSYDHALDNQRLFQTATSQERDALQKKFQAGDVNAIRAAISSGRASLSQQDQQAYNQAQANMARASTDNSLHGPQRAAVQQEQSAIMEGIMRRAEWKPDEQQPKSLQEQAQSRVAVIQDPTTKMQIPVYVDAKGNPKPLTEFLPKPVVDPNAPKPPKVLSEDEKRAAYTKQFNEVFKARTKIVGDSVVTPDAKEVEEHMRTINESYQRVHGIPKPEVSAAGASINEILGIPTEAPTTANTKAGLDDPRVKAATDAAVNNLAENRNKPGASLTPVVPPAAPVPAPAPKTLPPVKVGNQEYAPVGTMKTSDGKEFPIVTMEVPGLQGPQSVVVKNGKYIAIDVGPDGKITEKAEVSVPKYDSYSRPTAAPKEAVYVHSNDAASAKRAFDKGLTVYDEHGKVFRKK